MRSEIAKMKLSIVGAVREIKETEEFRRKKCIPGYFLERGNGIYDDREE
jgi:hypothetical protein